MKELSKWREGILSHRLQVKVFIFEQGDYANICAVNGKCGIADLEEIEKDINEYHDDEMVDAGSYTFECRYFPCNYDDAAAGCDIDLVKSEPFKDYP